jgi:hypothetical protein
MIFFHNHWGSNDLTVMYSQLLNYSTPLYNFTESSINDLP